MLDYFLIRGEQGKSLIDDVSLVAEFAHVAVPSEAGEAAVLNELRHLCPAGFHLLQVLQRYIADSEQACSAGVALCSHCFPYFGVRIAPSVTGGGPVQHEAVDIVGVEML